jgi:hypothetical protein
MSVRSRYRQHIAAEEIPASEKIKINGEPAEAVEPPKPAVAISVEKAAEADEATERLRKQLADLQHSEQLQRQRAAHMAVAQQQDQAINFWRHNGVSDTQLKFLLATPGALDRLTDLAGNEAVQRGHQYGTPAHTEAAVKIFRDRLNGLEAQTTSHAPAQPTQHEPEPLSFRPAPAPAPAPPPPRPQPEVDRATLVSAPVSRGDIGSYSRSPSQVRLSPAQREAAMLSGLSEFEYAKQLLKLDLYKRERGVERE